MRMIGRLSFPIFAFMLVEGFIHTSNRKKYLRRLAIFAVISEPPYMIFTYGVSWRQAMLSSALQNIFFELLLMFAALWFLEKARAKNKLFYLGAAAIPVLAEALGTMYGGYGVLMAMAFFLFHKRRWAGMACLAALTALYCVRMGSWFQIYAVFAAIPLYFYNGQRGQRLPRYFCYGFYPVHLLVIYALYWTLAPLL